MGSKFDVMFFQFYQLVVIFQSCGAEARSGSRQISECEGEDIEIVQGKECEEFRR